MGNVFLEYFNENTVFLCKCCKAHIAPIDNLKNTQIIETIYGEALHFEDVINCTALRNYNSCTYIHHDRFDMFDDNSTLENNIYSYFLYCKQCLSFIGWKYGYKRICLKKSLI